MRIIPVLDLQAGQCVHAVAGDRARYRPLRSRFAPTADPVAVARGIRDRTGADSLYLADLDAIVARAEPAYATFRAIADLGLVVWADAGIADAAGVAALLDAQVGRVVVGLETVGGPGALAAIVDRAGAGRAVFSLDLRHGRPILPARHAWLGDPPDEAGLVAQAVGAGVRSILRLDLAAVGTGLGVAGVPPAPSTWPGVEWVGGGGVATAADLEALARLGYGAALVGSALHDGRIAAPPGGRGGSG